MTNQQVLERAMVIIGALDSGGTPTATELADMLSALNQMMTVWAENDMDLKFPPQDTQGDTYPLPLWTEEPVIYNLAVRAATIFDLPVPPDVAYLADQGKQLIARKIINDNIEPVDLSHLPGIRTREDIQITSGSTSTAVPGNVWVSKTSGTAENLRSIYNQGDLWVACGDNGVILTSDDDGDSWTTRTSGVSYSLRTVKYFASNWWIVGYGHASGHTVLKSSDAITWTPVTISGLGSASLVTIGLSDDTMMFGGWQWPFSGANAVTVTTTDGITFNVNSYTFYGVYGIEHDGTTWVIVGSNSADDVTPYMASSVDASTLTPITSHGFTYSIWAVAHTGTEWVCGAGYTGEIQYSDDLSTWTDATAPDIADEYIWRITKSNRSILLATGGTFSDGWISKSNDLGRTWVEVYANASVDLISKAWYGNSAWIAVGHSGLILKSVE